MMLCTLSAFQFFLRQTRHDTYGRSPGIAHSTHCSGPDEMHPQSRCPGLEHPDALTGSTILPKAARTIPNQQSASVQRSTNQGVSSHLGETISMRPNDRNIARSRIWVIDRDVLFHSEMEDLLLLRGRGTGVFSDVLAWNDMVDYAEGTGTGRHCEASSTQLKR